MIIRTPGRFLAYTAVTVVAVGLAFALSFKFLGLLKAQDTQNPTAEGEVETPPLPQTPQFPPSVQQHLPQQQNAQEQPQAQPIAPSPDAAQVPAQTPAQVPAQTPEAEAAAKDLFTDEAQAATPNALAEEATGLNEIEGFLEPFIYDIVNRRDPFLPYSEYAPVEEGGLARPSTPAQRFALEELKLVGIMWDVKDPKALFLDPQQDVLPLRRDDSIGNKNGYIAAIREGEVVVVEALRRRGDIIYRTKVLRIER